MFFEIYKLGGKKIYVTVFHHCDSQFVKLLIIVIARVLDELLTIIHNLN